MDVIEKEKCCGCYACYNICPKKAITMETDEKGFKYPVIDKAKCIECGMCKKVCPVLKKTENTYERKAYAIFNKDEKERLNSSSGGIFLLLARAIMEEKGVVYGASFDENFKVVHKKVESVEDIHTLMGSKYVQSDIGDTFKSVKEDLICGKKVLFTGTPCQIEGLKSFLLKDYDNLYTQDIICHGVPSPKVWEKYKEYRSKLDGKKPLKINFRNKENGWTLYNINFKYDDEEYKNNQYNDLYMKAFLKSTILRDSCYHCHFKKIKRASDITLADFWGVKELLPEMYDNKGTSLLIIHSTKGEELFNCIKKFCKYKECDLLLAIKENQAMIESSVKDPKRELFFQNLDKLSFEKLVKRYTASGNIIKKIKNKIKLVIKKISKKDN